MSVVFWIILICLLLVFIVALFSCVGNKQTKDDRITNLVIAVVVFVLMLAMNIMWR